MDRWGTVNHDSDGNQIGPHGVSHATANRRDEHLATVIG
jgi:hypothetical protein